MSAEKPGQEQDATFTNPVEGDDPNLGIESSFEVNSGDESTLGSAPSSLADRFTEKPGTLMSSTMAEDLTSQGFAVEAARGRLGEVYGAEAPKNPPTLAETDATDRAKKAARDSEFAAEDAAEATLPKPPENLTEAEPAPAIATKDGKPPEAPRPEMTTEEFEAARVANEAAEAAKQAAEAIADKAKTDAMESQFPVPDNLVPADSTVEGAITTKDGKPPEAPTGVPEKHLPKSPVQVVTPNVNPSMRKARVEAAEAATKAAEAAAKAERKANIDARNNEKRANRREAQAKRGAELRGIFKDEGGEGQTAPAIVEAMTTREKAMKHVKNRVGRVAAKLASGGQRFGNFVDRFRDSTDKDDQTYIDAMNKYSDLVNEYGSGASNFDIRAGKGADSFVASVKEESVADGEGGLSSRILFKTEPADVEFPTIEQQNRYLISDNGDVTVEAPDPQAGGEVRSKTLKPGNPGYGEIMSQLNAAIAAKTEAEENARTASDSMALAA
jgi:hypothetical protein